ncbi:hypothetical protein PM082_023511 [Marasmius tenuissimus]|nr:hypothetical protein PM082_023511 [Marasmius tenuissimus]
MILHAIEEAEKEMKGYDVEINRLKASIVLLEGKRNQLSSTITKYRASLSPVHRLPPEILAEIFKGCRCEISHGSIWPSVPPSSVVLSMVCGRWREVALSTTALWSYISIVTGSWPPLKHEKLFRATQMLVSRSKRHPLTIRFFSFHNSTPDVMDLLIQNCDRWYDVNLALSQMSLRHYVFRDIQGKVPLLEKLNLTYTGESPARELLDVFGDAPSLHTLHLSSDMVSSEVTLPRRQIHSLALCDCVDSCIYLMLPFFPHASEIEVYRVGIDDDFNNPGAVISSDARSLSITIDDDGQWPLLDRLFTIMELPKLQKIHIEQYDYSDRHWDSMPLRQCLIRSSCVLTSFHLDGLPISDEHIISLLQLLPYLEVLHIVDPNAQTFPPSQNMIVTHNFLQRLAARSEFQDWEMVETSSSSGVVVPRLKDLTLFVSAASLDQQALVDAVTSRWIPDEDPSLNGGLYCLRKVRLIVNIWSEGESLDDEVVLGILLALKCFVDVGLDVNIETRR